MAICWTGFSKTNSNFTALSIYMYLKAVIPVCI